MANLQNLGSKENPYDIIISGAGPVGLAAAIIGGRQNAKICVLEQASIPGPIARGETIHDDPIFAELLGENFFSSISTHQTNARMLNSPNCAKSFEIHRTTPSYLFPWRRLIDSLWQNAIKAGAYCYLNKRVIKPILEDGVCIGVELSDSELIYGRTVLACDGHQSLLGRFQNIPYDKINVPILKRKLSQYTDPYPGMTTFLLPAESIRSILFHL